MNKNKKNLMKIIILVVIFLSVGIILYIDCKKNLKEVNQSKQEVYDENFEKNEKIYKTKKISFWKSIFYQQSREADFTKEEQDRLNEALKKANKEQIEAYKNIKDRDYYVSQTVGSRLIDEYGQFGSYGEKTDRLRKEDPQRYAQYVKEAVEQWDSAHNKNYKDDIEAITSVMSEEEKQLYFVSKQLDDLADAEEDATSSSEEIIILLQQK